MPPRPHELTLRDLFWLVLMVGLALAWWVDRTREVETYYLHVYSTRVDPGFDLSDPYVNDKSPKTGAPVRVASIAITADRLFSAETPNNYEPTVRLKGKLTQRSTQLEGDLRIDIESPETAFEYAHSSPIEIEEPNPCWGGLSLHCFAV